MNGWHLEEGCACWCWSYYDCSLCLIKAYSPNSSALNAWFQPDLYSRWCWRDSRSIKNLLQASTSTISFGDFCAILWCMRAWFEINTGVWYNGVIGQHSDADVNGNRILQLQLCCNNALFVMNTFFQHSDLHGQTRVWDLCASGHSLISA